MTKVLVDGIVGSRERESWFVYSCWYCGKCLNSGRMASRERENLVSSFFILLIFLPPSADYSDLEDAVYLTTMDTPLVGIASARSK